MTFLYGSFADIVVKLVSLEPAARVTALLTSLGGLSPKGVMPSEIIPVSR